MIGKFPSVCTHILELVCSIYYSLPLRRELKKDRTARIKYIATHCLISPFPPVMSLSGLRRHKPRTAPLGNDKSKRHSK